MHQKLGPVGEVFINLFQGGSILTFEANFLPHVLGGVSSLYGFDIQVAAALFFFDCGIATVG